MRTLVIVGVLGVLATAAAAQSTGIPAVDSATVARQAWTRGSKAFGANDQVTAQREMTRAAAAWPTQATYLWGRLVTSALLGDTNSVLAAMHGFDDAGLGRAIARDTIFRGYDGVVAFRSLVTRLDSNIAPLVASRVAGTLPDSTFWPEGVDYDARTGNFYVASIRHRTIAELHPDGSVRELWPRERATVGAVMGVRVDSSRGVLWATMTGIPQMQGFLPRDTALAALLRIRISDGAIEHRWDIPASARGHALGDLAIGPDGDVFMTDSSEPMLYRLRPGRDTLERMTHPLFRSLQGMAATRDGRTLFVADYSHGLLSIDLVTGTVVRLVDVHGSTSLGCDGIVLDATGAVIAIQNGVAPARVMRFVVDKSRTRIVSATVIDRNIRIADEPTIGTIARGQFVYVANSQWDKYDEDGKRRANVPLTAPVLLAVPLPER